MTSVRAGQTERTESASLLRPLLFVLTFLLTWVGVNPLDDLSDPTRMAQWAQGNPLNQIAYLLVGGGVLLTAYRVDRRAFWIYARPIYWMTMGWLGVVTILSSDPNLGVRRLMLTGVAMALAGLALVLPRNERQFANMLMGIIGLILIVSFASVAIVPLRAIHPLSDIFLLDDKVVEIPVSDLAGDWRGVFPHKNIAAPMMVLFIFFGLYFASLRHAVVGWLIIIASGIFLYFTHGKTAMNLLPVILVLAEMVRRLRPFWMKAVVAVGGVVMVNVVTLGSAVFKPMQDIVGVFIPGNASFTGRTAIWQLAVENIQSRLLRGWGFDLFWGSSSLLHGQYSSDVDTMAWAADNAHNAYLDMALAGGIPALLLGMYWVLVTPLRDYQTIADRGASSPLTLLFLRIWLLGIYLSCFESKLLARNDPVWFTVLVAMFGLRALTMARVVDNTRQPNAYLASAWRPAGMRGPASAPEAGAA